METLFSLFPYIVYCYCCFLYFWQVKVMGSEGSLLAVNGGETSFFFVLFVFLSFFIFFKLSNSSGEAKGQTATEILKVALCFDQLSKSTVITPDPENSAGNSLPL